MRAKNCLACVCIFAAVSAGATDDASPTGLVSDAVPQVLTPARLKQAQVDVAASVTVLDREMIAALGARDIPEILRLVPGMMVTRVTGVEYSASYHGTNLRDTRRMQVLVDGMSVYQPGLSRILWSDLALSIDDIERIEITRGPDAAAYGANAFSAIINIITTHPQDNVDSMLRVAAGNRQTIDTAGRVVGHREDLDWRASFWTREDSGFDTLRNGADHRDDRRAAGVNWRSEYRPAENDRLEFAVGLKDGSNEEVAETYNNTFTRYESAPENSVSNVHMLGRWTRDISPEHVRHVQAYVQQTLIENRFRTCLDPILLSGDLQQLYALNPDGAENLLGTAAANPAGIPAFIASLPTAQQQTLASNTVGTYIGFQGGGYTEACGDVALDIAESRIDVEWQDTLRVNEALRVVAGASFRRDRSASTTYTQGGNHNDVWRLFGHSEYRMAAPLTLNIGAMLETDRISGFTVSPRAGLNWRVGEQQSLRIVSSRAVRTQDLYEEHADIVITFRNLLPVWPLNGDTARELFLTQQSPGNLLPEEINSHEVGYFGYFPRWRTDVDVRIFSEHLNKLISDPANPFSFSVNNNSFTRLSGIEAQVKHSIAPGSWLWASYAYIDNDSTHRIERKFTALHSGSLAVAHRFASNWNGSAAVYVQRDQNYQPGRWGHDERLDLRMARDFQLGGSTLQLSLNAQCRLDDTPHIFIDNNYDDRVYAYAGIRLTH